jgi:hypothetical protein
MFSGIVGLLAALIFLWSHRKRTMYLRYYYIPYKEYWDGDYLNTVNIIGSIVFGIIFSTIYFLFSVYPDFFKEQGLSYSPSGFIPVPLFITLAALLVFSGIIFMIYRIQVAGVRLYLDNRDFRNLLPDPEKQQLTT